MRTAKRFLFIFVSVVGLSVWADKDVRSSKVTGPSRVPVINQAELMENIFQCSEALRSAGYMTRKSESQTACAYNWISPASLPERYQWVYRIQKDRIEVFELRNRSFKTSSLNARDFIMQTGQRAYKLEISSPGSGEQFQCPMIAPPPGNKDDVPSQALRTFEESVKVREAMRSTIYPASADGFLDAWKHGDPATGFKAGGQTHFRKELKRALIALVCDCKEAQVVSKEDVEDIKQRLISGTAKYGYSEQEREFVERTASELNCQVLTSQL